MSMDFIGAVVPITRTREEAIEALHELSDEHIMESLKDTIYDASFSEELYTWPDRISSEPTGINREAMMKELEPLINTVYDIHDGKVRAAMWFRFGETSFVFAGGQSWGDTPEYFDEVSVASLLAVTYDESKTLEWVDA